MEQAVERKRHNKKDVQKHGLGLLFTVHHFSYRDAFHGEMLFGPLVHLGFGGYFSHSTLSSLYLPTERVRALVRVLATHTLPPLEYGETLTK